MTSDQRISLIIILQPWVVFRLLVSSAIRILLLIGLSWVLTSLSLSLPLSLSWSPHSFLFDPEKFGWLIFCGSVRLHSRLHFFRSHLWRPLRFLAVTRLQLFPAQTFVSLPNFKFCLPPFQLPPPQPQPSASLTSPGCCWKALPKQQSVRAIGYILPSAVKIKLGGKVVDLSLFGLPLPSTIFPSTSALTRRERAVDGRRHGRDVLDTNQSWNELLCSVCVC